MENIMSLRFDKLRFVKTLEKEANQSPEVAEAFAKALDEALSESQNSFLNQSEFKREMLQFRSDFDIKIAQLEKHLTESMYKMAGFIIVGIGAILGIFKFFG